MPAPDITVGEDILGTRRESSTGAILAQTGDVIAKESTGPESEMWFPPGFCGIPAAATAGSAAAQCVAFKTSGRDVVLATRDLRNADRYGELAAGETSVFATSGQARALFKSDGSVTLLTTSDNTSSGTTIVFKISPSEGLQFTSPWGGFSLGPDGFKVYTQDGATSNCAMHLDLDGNVTVVAATACKLAGAAVLLGPSATVANACAYGVAGPANLVSTCVFVSP